MQHEDNKYRSNAHVWCSSSSSSAPHSDLLSTKELSDSIITSHARPAESTSMPDDKKVPDDEVKKVPFWKKPFFIPGTLGFAFGVGIGVAAVFIYDAKNSSGGSAC